MSTVRRTALVLTLLVLGACGTARTIDTAHVATIACAADGEVHAQASQYAGGQYTLNGGPPVTFSAGFDLTLDGATAWTLVVTADDGFPTYTDSAGPCRTPSSTTTAATTTTCPDCVINTVVITTPPTSSTTTTSPPTPATFAVPGGTTTTTTVVPVTTTTVSVAESSTTVAAPATTLLPATTCPTCTQPPALGLPVTAGIGVTLWIGLAMLAVFVAVVLVMRRRS